VLGTFCLEQHVCLYMYVWCDFRVILSVLEKEKDLLSKIAPIEFFANVS
jgi:hypothetical protein